MKNNRNNTSTVKEGKEEKFIYTKEQIVGIKSMANLNIVKVLQGLDVYHSLRDRYPKYLTGPCPIHGGDNKNGFSWSYGKGIFKCWTNNCSDFGSDVFALISQLRGLSFYESINYLVDLLDINIDDVQISKEALENMHYIRMAKLQAVAKENVISNDILDNLDCAVDYVLKDRGFSPEIIKRYEPKFGDNVIIPHTNGRIVYPVRNIDGGIVGFTCRAIREDTDLSKWMNSEDFEKENYLFNLNHAQQHIKEDGIIIVTEGLSDVLAFENSEIENSVGVLGDQLSDRQINLILSSGAFNVILAFDGDKAGERAFSKISNTLNKYFEVYKFNIPESKKDVGEMLSEKIVTEYERIKEMIV